MQRHSRDMVRHHRERVIKNRKRQAAIQFRWVPEKPSRLSKRNISFHNHHCDMCGYLEYKRQPFNLEHELKDYINPL